MNLDVDVLLHRTCSKCGADTVESNPQVIWPESKPLEPRAPTLCFQCLQEALADDPVGRAEFAEANEAVWLDNLIDAIAAG